MAKKKTGAKKRRKARKFSKREEALIDKMSELIRDTVESELDEDSRFEQYEDRALDIANEAVRRELKRKLQTIADSLPKRLIVAHHHDSHGIREGNAFAYRRHLPGSVTYHSLVGPLRVRRFTYREVGEGNTSCVPLELSAGLMQRMTPKLARCIASGTAEMPSRRLEQMLLEAGRQPPSRSTIDRCSRDLGYYAATCNDEIEPEIRSVELVPAEAKTIVLGLDRTAVPMRPKHEWVDDNANRKIRPRHNPLSGKGAVKWRMDYVGTVTLVDANGDKLLGREYRAPAKSDPIAVVDRMMADLRQAMRWRLDLRVAVIQDGAPELWRLLRSALKREAQIDDWIEVLDWYHLTEHLAACAALLRPKGEGSDKLRKKWEGVLLSGRPMSCVTRSIGRLASTVNAESQETIRTNIKYFKRNAARTNYCACKSNGVPIGSGPTEGACKSLVQGRAKKSGQRWSQRGVTAVLQFRAVKESERFDAYWPAFARRYRAWSLTPSRA